jgi:predicted transcriptional regulator
MFEQLIQRVQENICIIQETIQTNERLRKIAFEETPEMITIREYFQTQELTKQIIQGIPNRQKWLEYDRCAVVTRLYAVYESFVENLIATWLQRLPEIIPRYADLDERIRNTHREGVGRLLVELKKARFSSVLTDRTVVESLFSGIAGYQKYNLIPQAFLFHEQNLRKDILEKLLADAGIPNT